MIDHHVPLYAKIMGMVQHYNPQKYWKMRDYVISITNMGGYTISKLFGIYIE